MATQSEGLVTLIFNVIMQRGLLNEKRKTHRGLQEGIIGAQAKTMTLDMTEVILQGYQDDLEWAERFRGVQVLTMSNN